MKRVPRNKAIEIVLQGHIQDIEQWIKEEKREELKTWLHRTLGLGRLSVSDMINNYGSYFSLIEDDEDV